MKQETFEELLEEKCKEFPDLKPIEIRVWHGHVKSALCRKGSDLIIYDATGKAFNVIYGFNERTIFDVNIYPDDFIVDNRGCNRVGTLDL